MPAKAEKETKEKTQNTKVTTPEFRVAFPAVFQARSAAQGQEPKFSIQMLFPKATDLSVLKQAAGAAAVAKWGADKTKWPKGLKLPFRDGSEKDYDGYENTTFITASSKMRPGLVDVALQAIIEPSEFYGGCYARATVNAFAYDKAGNKGISFGLQNIQKLRDGEPFSGRSRPEQDFDAIVQSAGGTSAAIDALDGIGV